MSARPEVITPGRATPTARASGIGTTVGIAAIVVVMLAYYFWTAVCSFDTVPAIPPRGYETDHFNLLSRGFLAGHLHLEGEVPAALLTSPNPYDPALRRNVEVLHDASYFRGKYYIYFGPGPVVALLLPFTVLTGHDLPLPYAVWLFTCAGVLALLSVLISTQRRYYPDASAWTLIAAVIGLGGASMVVALLRRPHIWETSASAGFCFFALSVRCLFSALHSRRPVFWCGWGGLALGMAVASRPTYIVCSAMFVVPWLMGRWRMAKPDRMDDGEMAARYTWRAVASAAAACGLMVAALLVYNYARFENPFEFGQKYQLSAIIEGDARHFSVSYLAFNAYIYLLAPLRWLTTFPFHHGIVVPPAPVGHGGYEYAIGMFANLPFSLLAVAAVATLVPWRRGQPTAFGLRTTVAVLACAALLTTMLLCGYFGTCIRYMVDFAPVYMLLAGIGLLALESQLRAGWSRGALRMGALGLALFSTFAAAASVVDLYNHPLRAEAPTLPSYRPIARALNYPTFWRNSRIWTAHTPREIELSFPARPSGRHEVLVTVSRGRELRAKVFVEYQDGGKVRLGYREADMATEVFSAPFDAAGGGRHRLQLDLGSQYRDYDGYRARLRAEINGQPLWDIPAISLDASPGHIAVGKSAEAPFTGTVHSVRPLSQVQFTRAAVGGARVRVTLTPAQAGRSFPLVTSGKPGAGDLLFLRVHPSGNVTFGYDHWGDPLLESKETVFGFGTPRVVEVWMPAVAKEIVVRVDGVTVWRQAAGSFPARAEQFFVAANPIGATTAERYLENAMIEARGLPLGALQP